MMKRIYIIIIISYTMDSMKQVDGLWQLSCFLFFFFTVSGCSETLKSSTRSKCPSNPCLAMISPFICNNSLVFS